MTTELPARRGENRRFRIVALLAIVLAIGGGCTQQARVRPDVPPPAAPTNLTFGSAQRTAILCARSAGLNVAAFTTCTQERLVLTQRQQSVIACALDSRKSEYFAECVAPQFGVTLNRPQIVTADCAVRSRGTKSTFIACAGTAAAGRRITPREQSILGCAAKANDDATRFTACSAQQIIGPNASREQKIALTCAAQVGASYPAFLTCAGANLFNVKLNPDQTVAIECIIQVGGIPSAAVGCMAVRFVTRELRSCTARGFGGAHGCFGDDDMLIGRNGWTMREIGQLGSTRAAMVASIARWNETGALMRRTRSWWHGSGTFVRDPAAFWRARNDDRPPTP